MNSLILGKVIFQKMKNLVLETNDFFNSCVFRINNFRITFRKNSSMFKGEIEFLEMKGIVCEFERIFSYKEINSFLKRMVL